MDWKSWNKTTFSSHFRIHMSSKSLTGKKVRKPQLFLIISFQLCVDVLLYVSLSAKTFEGLWGRSIHAFDPLTLGCPWANWRTPLLAGSEHYRMWSVLSCAISRLGTVNNLSPWEPSNIISISWALLFRTDECKMRKAFCKQIYYYLTRPQPPGTNVPEPSLRDAKKESNKHNKRWTHTQMHSKVVILDT